MGYSDDQSSPTAPFSGDGSGAIFEGPDVVWQSQTTTERAVDTQSGFLVLVKQLDSRLALSVKRRLGTPPVSSVLLTPDESIKLSKILASHFEPAKAQTARAASEIADYSSASYADLYANKYPNKSSNKPTEPTMSSSTFRTDPGGLLTREPAAEKSSSDEDMATDRLRRSRSSSLGRVTLQLALIGLAFFAGLSLSGNKKLAHRFLSLDKEQNASSSLEAVNVSASEIEPFVRLYVERLLDFSPNSYRGSQIQAMSLMSPELMTQYWRETHFPISSSALAKSYHQQSLTINEIQQKPADDQGRVEVNVLGQLTEGNHITPLHLKLQLERGKDGHLLVVDQKDLSSAPEEVTNHK